MIFCCHDILSIFHYMLSQLHILQILKIYGLKEVLLYFWVFFIRVKLFLSFEEMETEIVDISFIFLYRTFSCIFLHFKL